MAKDDTSWLNKYNNNGYKIGIGILPLGKTTRNRVNCRKHNANARCLHGDNFSTGRQLKYKNCLLYIDYQSILIELDDCVKKHSIKVVEQLKCTKCTFFFNNFTFLFDIRRRYDDFLLIIFFFKPFTFNTDFEVFFLNTITYCDIVHNYLTNLIEIVCTQHFIFFLRHHRKLQYS